MPDQGLFDNKQKPQEPAGNPSTTGTDPFADKLGQITNPDGQPKYKDVDTALDALAASQQFIEQLKSENQTASQKLQEAESKLAEMGSIEDFVNRLQPKPAEPSAPAATPKEDQGLSEEKVAELLEQRLTERERKQAEASNLQSVVSELSKLYGDKARDVIQLRAKEMNTTPDEIKQMAMRNPTMTMNLLKDVKIESSPNPSHSTTTPPQTPPNSNERPTIEKGKGIARGGRSNKDLVELMRESKKFTNKRLGIEE